MIDSDGGGTVIPADQCAGGPLAYAAERGVEDVQGDLVAKTAELDEQEFRAWLESNVED